MHFFGHHYTLLAATTPPVLGCNDTHNPMTTLDTSVVLRHSRPQAAFWQRLLPHTHDLPACTLAAVYKIRVTQNKNPNPYVPRGARGMQEQCLS